VNIWLLYTIAFVHECISLFFLPARDASVPLLVPERALEEANGLILATSFGSIPIAAALFGGLRLAASHIPAAIPFGGLFRTHPTSFAFFFDAGTFVFSALMIAGLSLAQERRKGDIQWLADLQEGIRYLVSHRGLRSLAYGLIVSMFGGGVLFAVGIGYIHQTLGASDVAFGWLAALWGLGMGLGLLFVQTLIKERGKAPTFLAAVTTCGAVLIFMAFVTVVWVSFIAAILFGAAFSVAIVIALSMTQEVTEDRIRGRIMGGVQMMFRVGLGVGALGIGAMAHSIDEIKVGFGAASLHLDGNQVGLLAGGVLILLGAGASSGVAQSGRWAHGEAGADGGR